MWRFATNSYPLGLISASRFALFNNLVLSMRVLHHFTSSLCRFLRLSIVCVLFFLTGCAGHQSLLSPLEDALDDNSTELAATELLQQDKEGDIPQPTIPPELVQAGKAHTPAIDQGAIRPIVYTVVCESPDDPKLSETFLQISTLTRMKATPLHSLTGLEQRLGTSLQEGKEILHSFGYYTGHVRGSFDVHQQAGSQEDASPLEVKITVDFTSGPQYTVGKTQLIHARQKEVDAGTFPLEKAVPHMTNTNVADSNATPSNIVPSNTADANIADTMTDNGVLPQSVSPEKTPYANLLYAFHPTDAPSLPQSLEDVGLASGSPALAGSVLDAVDAVQASFRNSGYPNAQISTSQYFLNHDTQTLDVEILLLPGQFMRMGEITLPQGASVDERYLAAKQTWKYGQAWNQNRIEAYRDLLRQTGLFVSIDLAPGKDVDAEENHPIEVTLAAAPERTVGGSLKYDTSFGPGVQAFWEHRNLTGNGDSLRLELPVWRDMQEFTAKYRLPFFQRDDQDFIAQLGILNEDVDAYNLQAARISTGIDRRLSRHWKITAQGSAESGSLKDPKKPREDYMMVGMPLNLAFDSTNSLLDATKGGRASLNLAPYTGEYHDEFTVLRSRLDLQRFIPLVGDDTLVLAMRGTLGTMSGAKAGRVPPSVRFYSGGGGSVRGYEYQSLGPRNYRDDPLGGSALTEVSIEPRWRFSETFGVVAFLDGGMAYEDVDELGKDLRWGAGIGLRLYTPIGPVRLDVATPLNPRDDDDPVQIYLSIGQSF